MTNDRDDVSDGALRRSARASIDQHRRSVPAEEVETALRSTHDHLDSAVVHRRRSRRVVSVAAAAVVVVLLGALALVSNPSDERVATAPSPAPTAAAPPPPSSSTTWTSAPTTTAATTRDLGPASVFDVNGDPIALPIDGDSGNGGESPFVDVLLDYLIHRSDLLGGSVDERRHQLEAGGLRIHTTLDPETQRAAIAARNELPANASGIDAAIVSLDTTTGAVRAVTGPTNDRAVNMAVAPRQTGTAIGFFVVAAAVEAGARGDDVIDGERGCEFPTGGDDDPVYTIDSGVVGSVGPLREVVWLSVLCGTTRLSSIVGLDKVVDTTYRMAASAYLDPTDPESDRQPLEPFLSFASGANEMSPLDMASGIQTLANEGVHHDPYFVEHIDDADGNRVYTHWTNGSRVLDRDTSLETIDIYKGVLRRGTARRNLGDLERPAFGATGTQEDNTNAWFVGATPQLATAVWVGDPDAYTQMIDIPEFAAAGVSRVQGGRFPAQIWRTFVDAAHGRAPATDWAPPPAPARDPVRLVLSGNECLAPDSSTESAQEIPPGQPLTTVELDAAVVPCR